MSYVFKISPALPYNFPAESPKKAPDKPFLMDDSSLEFLSFSNPVFEFLHEARHYWSKKGLLAGYIEAINPAVEYLQDSSQDANPIVQACLGSTAGVANLMGTIPFGLAHAIHESVRDFIDKDLGTGVETFGSTYVEGIREGAKYLLHQVDNWSHGKISPSTFGVAYEVSTTLGTAVLMFLGIKGIHRGGSNMIQGFKQLEIPQPTLATNLGALPPVALAGETLGGLGPMRDGLIFMAGNKKEEPCQNGDQGKVSRQRQSGPGNPASHLEMLVKEDKLPTDNPYITVLSRRELDGYGFRISTKTKKLLLELENASRNSKLALRFQVSELLRGNAKYLRSKHLEGLLEITKAARHNGEILKYWEPVNYHVAILTYALMHFPRSMAYALKDFNLSSLQRAVADFPQVADFLLKIEKFEVAKPNGR